MIRFQLTCENDHRFESWFQSGTAFDNLLSAGHLACETCGSRKVAKSMMAPAVKTDRPTLAEPEDSAVAALREKVETTSDYVGLQFASKARAMHEGTIPEKPIYGEARGDEARKLLEDGIPVLPLPFIPRKRSN